MDHGQKPHELCLNGNNYKYPYSTTHEMPTLSIFALKLGIKSRLEVLFEDYCGDTGCIRCRYSEVLDHSAFTKCREHIDAMKINVTEEKFDFTF